MYQLIGRWTEDEERLETVRSRIKRVPRPVTLAACSLAGAWIGRGTSPVRRTVERNLSDLFPEQPARRIRKLSRRYFRHWCLVLYELLLEGPPAQERFEVDGEAHLEEALDEGRGAILLSAHMGNFFHTYCYLSRRYPCLTVATAGSEELRPLYLRFRDWGCRGLDYDHTPPLTLIRTLRRHLAENGVVFLLGDFSRPSFPPGRFFGRWIRHPHGAARLALEKNVPLLPCRGTRSRGFRHRIVIDPPMSLQPAVGQSGTVPAAERINRKLEEMIRGCPEQWFYWFDIHERWDPCPGDGEEHTDKRGGAPVGGWDTGTDTGI